MSNLKLLLLLMLITLSNAIAQVRNKIIIRSITDVKFAYVLCSTDTLYQKSTDAISINLFLVGNPSGSAHLPESDEISHKYYIAVSSIDDAPEQHLYAIGDFTYPKIISFKKNDSNSYTLSIQHRIKDKNIVSSFLISLKGIKLIT